MIKLPLLAAATLVMAASANAATYADWNNFSSGTTTIAPTGGTATGSTLVTPTANGSSTLNLATATSTNTFKVTPGDTTLSTANTSQWTLFSTFTLNNALDTAVETIFTANVNQGATAASGNFIGLYGLSFNTNSGAFNVASFTTLNSTAVISGWGTSVAKTSTISTAFYHNNANLNFLYSVNGGAWVDSGISIASAFSGRNLGEINLGSQTAGTASGNAAFNTTNFPNTGSAITLSDFQIQTGAFTAVPEPSTYGLMGAGALAAVALVRRRRKAA